MTSRSDSSDGAVPRSHSEKHCSVRSENMFQLSCYPDLQTIPTFPRPPTPLEKARQKGRKEGKDRGGNKGGRWGRDHNFYPVPLHNSTVSLQGNYIALPISQKWKLRLRILATLPKVKWKWRYSVPGPGSPSGAAANRPFSLPDTRGQSGLNAQNF